MKKELVLSVVTGLTFGIVGYFLGSKVGFDTGYRSAENMLNFRSIEQIKQDLRKREEADISAYIQGKASLKNVDEGSLFKRKMVQYFKGSLTNSSTLVTAKDVKLNVDFFSKTGSKIGSQQITVYEFIAPGRSVEFNEKIVVPDKVDSFTFQIVEVGFH